MSDGDLMLAADWSELPGDLLGLIIENSFFLLDYIRFGAVCFEWRSFCIQNYEQIKLPSNLPLLLIPNSFQGDYNEEEEEEEEERIYDYDADAEDEHHVLQYYYKPKMIWQGQDAETRHQSTRSFYSLSQRKVYQDFRLPVPYYKSCRGSSYGWLITVDEEEQPDGTYTYPVRLLNPFRSTNYEIQLPPLTTIPGGVEASDDEPVDSYFLIKAYLSANPSSLTNPSKDLLVLGVLGRYKFGFCRPGDTAWTRIPLEDQFRPIEDLICYKGRFRAIIQNGSVLELDFAHHHLPPKPPSVKFVALTPANADNLAVKYLVESVGDLLQVHRHVVLMKNSNPYYSTSGFQVFKLNEAAASDDDDKWVEMDTLDGRMLFLGDNSSISLPAADFPGLMPNCIYFTDDNHEAYEVDPWVGPHDIGVFNFEDRSVVFVFGDEKSFDPHYAKDNTIMPPPIWIQPML